MITRSNAVRRRLAIAACLLSIVALAGSASAGSPPPPADPPTTLAGQPEVVQSWALSPGGSPNGDEAGSRSTWTYDAVPGSTFNDTAILYNYSNVPMTFTVYATDAFNNDDGQFDLLAADEVPTDVGSWITLDAGVVELAPFTQAQFNITINVPPDATPGDHAGAIVAANVAVADNGDGTTVNVERRTGSRVYIQVAPSGTTGLVKELAVTDINTDYHPSANPLGGSADVQFTVENRGNIRLAAAPTVSVGGPFGIGRETTTQVRPCADGPQEVIETLPELLPGQKSTWCASLDGVPALGLAFTEVRLDPTPDAAAFEPVVGKDRTFAPPITLLLIGLLIAIGALTFRAYRRRRVASPPVDEWASHNEHEPA